MIRLGLFLEAGYKKEGTTLYCEDIYTLLWTHLKVDYDLSFLGRYVKRDCRYELPHGANLSLLSSYDSLLHLLLLYPFFVLGNKKKMNRFIENNDIFLIMVGSPLANLLTKMIIKKKKHVVLLVRQDTKTMISQRYTGFKRCAASGIASKIEQSIIRLLKEYSLPMLTVGSALYKKYSLLTPNAYFFVSSRFHLSDIVSLSHFNNKFLKPTLKVLFVGRIEVNTGLNELLGAIREVKGMAITFTIVGDGLYMNELKRLLDLYSLTSIVSLEGYIPYGERLLGIYQENDVLILPSYSEGLPQVILEAMASGCVVAATKVGGIPSVITHESNGLLFAPHSSQDIVAVLRRLYLDSALLENLAKNGLITARQYAFENQFEVLKRALVPNL